MGIEKIDPKTQAIINALKDGRINEKEFDALNKEFGLTKKEAAELNKAFSSGEAKIGDYVLVNKGQKDGKQFSLVVKSDSNADEKALKTLGQQAYEFFIGRYARQAKNIARPFWRAFKNNDGAENIAKAMPEAFKDSAKAAGEATVENLKTAAKVGLAVLGGALVSCSSDDPPEDPKIKADDFNKDNKDKDAVIGGNNVYVTNIVNVNIPVKVEVDMNAVKAAIGDLINANNANFAAVLSAIAGLTNAVDKNGQETKLSLDALLQVAEGILSASGTIVENQEEILAEIKAIRAMVKNIDATVNKIDADLTVNGQNVKAELQAILEAVKAGNITVEQFKAKMEAFGQMLKEIILNQKTEIKLQETANMTLDEIKELLNKPDLNLDEIIAILNDIKSITTDIKEAVNGLKNDVAEYFRADAYFKTQLLEGMNKMQGTQEQQKALLEQILEAIKQLGTDNKNYYLGIINAMSKEGAKIDDVTALLKTINSNVVAGKEQNKEYGDAIIALLAKLGDTSAATLNAILKNNTKMDDVLAILKTINNNVVEGNKIAENYGKQVLEAVKAGNLKLDDIRKLVQCIDKDMHKVLKNQDVIIDNQNTGLALGNAIFAWLKDHPPVGGGGSDIDYTAMLNKMYAKLDEILKAIKDHDVHVTVDDLNITVDLEGKVTCECNCGGHKHEGILGDLNDLIN